MKTKKILALALTAALLVAVTVGGTIAYLQDTTKEVKNTFTPSDINIKLEETEDDFKMIPGDVIDKDPLVTVEAGSEDLWLFVKVIESANLDTFITYNMASGWTALSGFDGVYYREVAASDEDQEFQVLANDQVTVNSNVTKAQMNELTATTNPSLTFQAYAVQQLTVDSATAAWNLVKDMPAKTN